MNAIPLTLYIHIPWCVRKCPYCDFNSHEYSEIPEPAYLTALVSDLTQDSSLTSDREIQSVFIGGGTPSLMSPQFYEQLFLALKQRINLAANAEITLEANPGTVEYQKFSGFRAAGINRLSLGVQSFQPHQLAALGRIHNDDEARQAVLAAQQAGFSQINIDLMHGLPNQTPNQALDDLAQAVDLKPTHLSWYQLTIEPNTVFYNQPPTLPSENILGDIEDLGFKFLQQHGFQQYETSAFAQPHAQCRHNLNYWQYGDYLAIGAGAHGKITDPINRTITRYQKTRAPADYFNPQRPFTAKQQLIPESDRAFEFFMNTFRLHQPIAKTLFEQRTLLPQNSVAKPIADALEAQLITETASHWQTTALGQRYLNTLLTKFC